ncbi:metallophosphoesterase [Flavobacteriaceae sp. LMIT009]
MRLDSILPRRKHLIISSLYGLTVSSFIPKITFVLIISILYYSNFIFSETESVIIVPLVGLLSGFFPFFVILYGIFITVYRFKVYHHKIKFEELPRQFRGLRIVQLSDLHLGSFNYRYHILKRAIDIINQLKPDLIFITGDLINNYSWELKGWNKIFNELNAKEGKFSVLGNHDYGDYSKWKSQQEKEKNLEEVKTFYKDIGFTLLLNEAELLKRNNESIAIIGVENWGLPPFKQYGNLSEAKESVLPVPFKILLSHDPTHWKEEVVGKTDISLTFSGHTHGMQAGFQYKNKRWSPIKYKYKHWSGLYGIGKNWLYVNRGLGWLGFPGRLGMRPEITFIELI